ncbi:RNA polymerase III subunit I [Rhynchophorus ferrugineus]|uniref:DNA-directed RNA polymerase III subunit RPC9 n=1 Tax=Rhynchophorus ferrugineus TaxID=354439 RepID=A0A834MKM8_RHYFE|nr:hypothetical protein GWI33_004080 [Rhynchophorus ferrugineus]
MEIINSNAASLSNYEVFIHLQKIKESKKKQKGQLATITYETLRYLEETPSKSQTNTSITQCLKELQKFNLNKTEKLMLINSPPSTPLEIQLMIEESEERLTEEQVQEILSILNKHFPFLVPVKMENEENSE